MPDTAQDYDQVKSVLQGDNEAARIMLACAPDTPREVLYFLCDDTSVPVRRAVAENPNTPAQADTKLARDSDVSVRCALARKAVGSGLGEEDRRNLWRMGFTILETLMRDQVVRVRRVLTEALATDSGAPHAIVVGLARDREETVAAPVLTGSPLLTDDDMLSILQEGAPDWAKRAMAARATVSPALGAGLANGGAVRAMTHIVANPNAPVDRPAARKPVEKQSGAPETHSPDADRQDPPRNVLVRVARLVAAPLFGKPRARPEIDEQPAPQAGAAVAARDPQPGVDPAPGRDAEPARARPQPARPQPAAPQPVRPRPDEPLRCSEDSVARARKLHNAGVLTDNAVAVALDSGETGFVIEALALRTGYRAATVQRMIASRSARTVVALAWKAGFGARFAMDLQRQLARIPPTRIINARGGVDFALKPAEMKEQLAFFT